VSTRKRDEVLSGALSSIAAYGITVAPIDQPAQFVRELSLHWRNRGGRVAGRPRHSDRYLDNLLKLRGTPVRSLAAKLAGKMTFEPDDADALVRLCLLCWHYVDDRANDQSTGDGETDRYQPMLPKEEVIEVASYVNELISASRPEGAGALTLPGEKTGDLIAAEFARSDAMFSVSSGRTLITPNPKQALIGFRNTINRLWEADRSDNRDRMLAWVVDLGQQEFEDASPFWNVQELRSRFKALRVFKEPDAESRWRWLQSRAVIVLHNPRMVINETTKPPAFTVRDALFSEIPRGWRGLKQIRTLYGRGFNSQMGTFTIFLRRAVEGSLIDFSSRESSRYEFRYFAHVLLAPQGHPSELEARGLELPPPGEGYEDAFGTIYAAVTKFLRPGAIESMVGAAAIKELHSLRFQLMDLEAFVEEL